MIARGHRTSIIGVPAFGTTGRGGFAPHRPTAPAISAPRNRSVEALADRNHERARRALWLDCERAPLAIVRSIPA